MRHGGDIYGKNSGRIKLDFSVSLNPLGAPDSVRRAYLHAVSELEHYPDPECRQLRKAIAQRNSIGDDIIQDDQVVCGNGASELFLAAGLALQKICRKKGNHEASVLIPVPTYSGYEYAMRAAGVRTDFYQMQMDEGFSLTERFLEMLENRTGAAHGEYSDEERLSRSLPTAVFVCTPNNPVGNCVEPELLAQLNDFSRRNEIFLFVDECYMALTGHGEATGKTDYGRKEGDVACSYSARRYLRSNPYLVVFDAFTKTYAIPGLRLGYAICGDPDFAELLAQCRSEWSVSIPAQAAGIAALRESDYLGRAVKLISGEKEYCIQALRRLGMKVYPGDANFLMFETGAELYEPLLDRGILIRDCGGLRGFGGAAADRRTLMPVRPKYYRIGVHRHEDNICLINVLEAVLTRHQFDRSLPYSDVSGC